MKKINPFKPHSPVPTAMFAGRLGEIDTFETALFQTKSGNPSNLLITGERGIGKSSLLTLFKPLANGEIKSPDYENFNFITLNAIISNGTNLVTFIKLIQRNLQRELGKEEIFRKIMGSTWDFVQRIKVMDSGIEKSVQTSDPDLVIDDFSYSLAETCNRVCDPDKGNKAKDGIVIFIDEADNACEDLQIGYLLKATTELLQQHGCSKVMFVVAGLNEVIEKLSRSHESSLRIFTQIKVKELRPEDRHYVVDRGIEEGNRLNDDQTTVSVDAKNHISTLSEGYPHFIQQFAYSAFEANTDGEISADDVLNGAFDPGGQLMLLGLVIMQLNIMSRLNLMSIEKFYQ
ncbi:AAA family ATPase [Photobacterium sp. 1_MG-2023]|uniref:AAA family ATPase n=1 Tax=Photobacterium sp. 1_MG-2023 TaxID=3062646 RepID=UPI0026E2A405|nr:ATP-binding protein [Photobacterium sp. 1_MG-2023]MDO6709029.1 ATP-binding protein [Photobacterium sp. 1_MG-2023]